MTESLSSGSTVTASASPRTSASGSSRKPQRPTSARATSPSPRRTHGSFRRKGSGEGKRDHSASVGISPLCVRLCRDRSGGSALQPKPAVPRPAGRGPRRRPLQLLRGPPATRNSSATTEWGIRSEHSENAAGTPKTLSTMRMRRKLLKCINGGTR